MSGAEQDAAVMLLAKRGYPVLSIAHLTGLSGDTVLRIAGERGIGLGNAAVRTERMYVSLAAPAVAVLAQEAQRRDLSPATLARFILEQALAGGPGHAPMVSAVLGE